MNFPDIELLGMRLASCGSEDLLEHLFASLGRGEGGWLVTANLDIVRRAALDPHARGLYGAADLRVADGMPLVWASQLMGRPLPERVAGSTLTGEIARRAAREGRSLFLLGGAEGAAQGARAALERAHPELRVLGTASPFVANPPTPSDLEELREAIGEEAPDILFVGMGSPKQEEVIAALRPLYPQAWMIGVGITFSFLAGQVERAPAWMQRTGTEWVHRMVQEPDRLVRRYLIDDLPFAAVLFADALRQRLLRRR
ncbi:MAG: WecB/TagA/CpsF family glycosyltransferase [Myxococcales bacterium]|nr:WecB/TagA/CpsF family glycosyltransferase [Myxococcales bacterium]